MYRTAYYTALTLGKMATLCVADVGEGYKQNSDSSGFSMPSDEHILNDLFDRVVDLPVQERAPYLDKHCSNNPVLKTKIQKLLKGVATPAPEEFLDPANLLPLLKSFSEG